MVARGGAQLSCCVLMIVSLVIAASPLGLSGGGARSHRDRMARRLETLIAPSSAADAPSVSHCFLLPSFLFQVRAFGESNVEYVSETRFHCEPCSGFGVSEASALTRWAVPNILFLADNLIHGFVGSPFPTDTFLILFIGARE